MSRSFARLIPIRAQKPGEPWVVVDVKAIEPLPKPVTLDAIKAEPRLKAMVLVNNTRLSVQPVTDAEWKIGLQDGRIVSVTLRCERSEPRRVTAKASRILAVHPSRASLREATSG